MHSKQRRQMKRPRKAHTNAKANARSKRGCPTGKRRYPDKKSANQAIHNAVAAVNTGQSHRGKTPTRCYACHICKGYHLTSQNFDPGRNT